MAITLNVSVIIPAYQAEGSVAKTLATVAAQTKVPQELIVVDDGSTDSTCDIVESFAAGHPEMSVRLLREQHRGAGAARNTGIRAARSEWIAFLDADDLWHPEKLEKMIRTIQAHPEANFYCHNETIRFLDGHERMTNYSAGFSWNRSIPRQLYQHNYFSPSAVICRRDLVLRWGGFDETLSTAEEDYELWLRISPDILPVFVPEALGTYVLHQGNLSNRRSSWKGLYNMLRVKHRHRTKAGVSLYLLEIIRSIALHFFNPFRALLSRGV